MAAEVEEKFLTICRRALQWARERDYAGYSKHDALNSPLLEGLSLDNKWLRILFTQAVMRSPVNLRPLFGVRKTRNAKGIALFARAWLNLFRLTGDPQCRREAEALLDWLLANPSIGFCGLSWGYPYAWQDVGFFAPRHFPNRIVTYFVGRALVEAYEILGEEKYLKAALQVTDFILNEPKVLYEDEGMKCLSYVPVPDIKMVVMDVSALCGALCAMVGKHAGSGDLIAEGRRLVAYVVDKQTDYGAWYYTHPPGDSHITHDNYHTGEIIDAIADYCDYAGDEAFRLAYRKGLDYYRGHLFTEAARPKWMNDKVFPHDAHGYAQGIITFTRAGELELARRIAMAAIEDLWNEKDGRFCYQRRRFYTKGFTLARWSQGWLSFALSDLRAVPRGTLSANEDEKNSRQYMLPWA